MKSLKYQFLIVDIGFILYWLITAFQLLPKGYLFNDYQNVIIVAWNWSFLPLDLFISFTGISSLILFSKSNRLWKQLAIISLALTFCSGLQAIAFWAIKKDFDIAWWIPNLYLLIYPLFYIPKMLRKTTNEQNIDK